MLMITLTPCRSNPCRFSSIISYRRSVDERGEYVAPVRLVDGRVERVRWRDIAPSETDPEFEAEWLRHVKERS